MYVITCFLRLYCGNLKVSNTLISIGFDYRKMKNVEGLIRHVARNPGFGADFFLGRAENHTRKMPENHFDKIRHGCIVV